MNWWTLRKAPVTFSDTVWESTWTDTGCSSESTEKRSVWLDNTKHETAIGYAESSDQRTPSTRDIMSLLPFPACFCVYYQDICAEWPLVETLEICLTIGDDDNGKYVPFILLPSFALTGRSSLPYLGYLLVSWWCRTAVSSFRCL